MNEHLLKLKLEGTSRRSENFCVELQEKLVQKVAQETQIYLPFL